MTTREITRRRRLREASAEVGRRWDLLQDRVPAPVLRLLLTLPWVMRRMPVPFCVACHDHGTGLSPVLP